MRSRNTEHPPQNINKTGYRTGAIFEICYAFIKKKCTKAMDNRGQAEYVIGMYALIFVMVMTLASLQILQYKADSDIAEDALTASALAALDIDPYHYGETHRLIIQNPENARRIFEDALKDNMNLNDVYEPKSGNRSYVSGRVSIDDFRVYLVEDDNVREYIVSPDLVSENVGIYGEMKTPSEKDVVSAGVYAEISFDTSGFMGVQVRAHKNTYVEMMANPDL